MTPEESTRLAADIARAARPSFADQLLRAVLLGAALLGLAFLFTLLRR